ncbi:NADPH:quinone reductase-like Zn-dependent oxidoreductase [Lysobacter niastensis]|uniref:NADPH:quinone reductase-like Zn-dependent oxidoreductase n=1 Tax=Lysobacter niastensis TaxID=380629 RepID=A0ABU1W9V8_9GAMM|nr:zinc-dependent alcohol dehydrogenase family protein [Lysobacter niastensis]MDR7134390.1 NADPH:quinone reductase-like Zn-dependent oxidoreductase [Lysobacter niastensis]
MNAIDFPSSMLASVQESVGEPMRVRSVPAPKVEAGQVLVRVQAVGLNPLDTKIRSGKAGHAQHPLPAILGIDMTGVVVAVGNGVQEFTVGDEVFGMTGGVGGVQGALAQYAVVDPALLAHKPSAFTAREAAATPLVFITAWEGLVDRAHVGPDKKVLIHGGAGGIGHVAIQIAKAFGATVYATASPPHRAYIESLGATFIDYQQQSVDEYVAKYTEGDGFDIIFDTVGGATLDNSFQAVRRYHGHVVSALGWGTHSIAPLSFRAGTYSGVFTLMPLLSGRDRAHHGEIMREAARLADAGQLRLRIDQNRFTLNTAEEAYQYLESGDAGGKIVVEVE